MFKPLKLKVSASFLSLCTVLTVPVYTNTMEVSAAPITNSSAKIHFIALDASSDAILLESNGLFAMIDSGEDSDYPDGSDLKYPSRLGTVYSEGYEEQVISYMKSVGVTKDNFVFYLGTHPHSDHIGTADDVIRAFEPERVYLMEYSDEYISDADHLWDNLYVYDQAIQAAEDVNASLIQYFSPNAPVTPNPHLADYNGSAGSEVPSYSVTPDAVAATFHVDFESSDSREGQTPKGNVSIAESTDPNATYGKLPAAKTGNPNFDLGQFHIEIMNYSNDYQFLPKQDANMFSLGVKVSANGHTAFLGGDIENTDKDEDRLKTAIGKIDLLKLGHHGYGSASTPDYLNALEPSSIVCTGFLRNLPLDRLETISQIREKNGTGIYSTADYSSYMNSIIYDFTQNELISDFPSDPVCVFEEQRNNHGERIRYAAFKNGWYYTANGLISSDEQIYYFDNSCYAVRNEWKKHANNWYYLSNDGTAQKGWLNQSGVYYYFGDDAIMDTGWIVDSGYYYYLNKWGAMVTGWQYDNGYWYYLNKWGAMVTGWQYDRGTWYYLNKWGAMVTGWQYDRGIWYYLNQSGAMVTGTQVIDGKLYTFNANGALIS